VVQLRSEKANEFWAVSAQDLKRNDGNKVKKIDDKILSCNGFGSLRALEFYSLEI
jgi:hypothetical protein